MRIHKITDIKVVQLLTGQKGPLGFEVLVTARERERESGEAEADRGGKEVEGRNRKDTTKPRSVPSPTDSIVKFIGLVAAGEAPMAYVDHAFSISDEDIMMEPSYIVQNKPPIKEIALAVALLVFGTLGIVLGMVMAANRVGGDRAHGIFFTALGAVLFIPGFYYTRIAYYAYKGYKGFSFANIPAV